MPEDTINRLVRPNPRITGQIPHELTVLPLRGRHDDVSRVNDLLEISPSIPVCILGQGGLGKSKLAAKVAQVHSESEGIIWHQITTNSRDENVYDLLFYHFNVAKTGNPIEIARFDVLAKLKEERTLVVLDNAEEVPPGDSRYMSYVVLVNKLLANNAKVLITSRIEWTELKYRRNIEPLPLDLASAIQIVLDLAKHFQIPSTETVAIDVARNALYHPRLIEWAMELMRHLPREEVLNDLKNRESDDIQQVMDEMVLKTLKRMKSSDQYGEQANAALELMLVCRGGFTFDAALAIARDDEMLAESHDIRHAIQTLTTWGFLRFNNNPEIRRYNFPAIVTIAMEKFVNQSAYYPHFLYYFKLAQENLAKRNFRWFESEIENLDVSFYRVISASQIPDEDALRLSNLCMEYFINSSRIEQGLSWASKVVEVLRHHTNKEFLADGLNTLGILYRNRSLGDPEASLNQAITAYKEALKYWTKEVDPRNHARLHHNLGVAYSDLAIVISNAGMRRKKIRKAIDAYLTALDYRKSSNNVYEYLETLDVLGSSYGELANYVSDPNERISLLKESEKAFEKILLRLNKIEEMFAQMQSVIPPEFIQWQYHYGSTQTNLGLTCMQVVEHTKNYSEQQEYLQKADHAFEQALRHVNVETNALGFAILKRNLAQAHLQTGNLPAAIACARDAQNLYFALGRSREEGLMLKMLENLESLLSHQEGGSNTSESS